jgi:tetratricopeptide (TPR) repeat protein
VKEVLILGLACFLAAAAQPAARVDAPYPGLVARYRTGDRSAARDLARDPASVLRALIQKPAAWCHVPDECRAAAVLNLEASSLLSARRLQKDAGALLDATVALVNRQSASFAFAWLLAAGHAHQAYGDHASAYALYSQALDLKRADPDALLARATALEFSVIPDGFGAIVVADQDVWRLLAAGSEPPAELSYRLATASKDDPARRHLLQLLTVQYRDVLQLDPARNEARLRLGRVLHARGHVSEGESELRDVASDTTDPFCAAVARLCLARLETSPKKAAAAYGSALDVDPGLSQAWLGLSHALRASGDRTAARDALEHVLALGQTRTLTAWVEYHLGRGRVFPAALEALRVRVVETR